MNRGSSYRESLLTVDRSEVEFRSSKSGYLYKLGKVNSWKYQRRMFFMEGNCLFYYSEEDFSKARGLIVPLTCFEVKEEKDDEKKKQFHFSLVPKQKIQHKTEGERLTNLSRVYHLYAESKEDKEDWIEALTSACKGIHTNKEILEVSKDLRSIGLKIEEADLEFENDKYFQKRSIRKGKLLKSTDVAMKKIDIHSELELKNFYEEMKIASELRHANIVLMFGYCVKETDIYLVTEFVKGGNLGESIAKNPKIFSEELINNICLSFVSGMIFLHSRNFVHRDIRPSNVLIVDLGKGIVKISHLSRPSKTFHYSSLAYAAPESSLSNHTNKVDVFSFAVLLWQLCTKETPWNFLEKSDIPELVNKGARLTLTETPFRDLIRKCWDQDPDKRPSFKEVFEDLNKLKSSFQSKIVNEFNKKPEKKIMECFQNEEYLSWEDFLTVFKQVFDSYNESDAPIQKLKYCLTSCGEKVVHRETWKKFCEWFSPLKVISKNYFNIPDFENFSNFNWTIEQISNIIGNNMFFGFISNEEAENLLKNYEDSFLFHFSSIPRFYSLKVNHGGLIYHWNIELQKQNDFSFFVFEGSKYGGFEELVHEFTRNPLPSQNGKVFYLYKALNRYTKKLME